MAPNLTNVAELIVNVDASRPGDAPLERLAVAVGIARELDAVGDELVGHYVDGARLTGVPWVQIGAVLGVTKQAAHQRFTPRETPLAGNLPDGLFARFTDKARRTVNAAEIDARRRGHNYIGTEHILCGLVSDPEALSTKVLASLNIEPDVLRDAVTGILGDGQSPPTGSLPFTPRAVRVLELAAKEALGLGHNYVGTEHILIGVAAEGDGIGSQVLKSLELDVGRIRNQVIFWLSGYQAGRKK